MPDAGTDLLGNALTPAEGRLLDAYRALEALHATDDLAPAVRANVAEALASLWQALHDLALLDERPSV